jgi:hypothetical protein
MTAEGAQRYIRRGARDVQGWLAPEAATIVTALGETQHHGAIGEIGVYHGKLFILLDLLRRPGESAVAVDLFDLQHLNIDRSGEGDRQVFEANLARHSSGPANVRIHSADSTTITADDLIAWAGGRYRLFSVDGGHSAEITQNDLALASQVLADDGVLILDDYFNARWPGVSEGTCRFLLTDPDLESIGSGFNKMFFARPNAAAACRAEMRRVAERERWWVVDQEFFGRPHLVVRTRGSGFGFAVRRAIERLPVVHGMARSVKRRLARRPSSGE